MRSNTCIGLAIGLQGVGVCFFERPDLAPNWRPHPKAAAHLVEYWEKRRQELGLNRPNPVENLVQAAPMPLALPAPPAQHQAQAGLGGYLALPAVAALDLGVPSAYAAATVVAPHALVQLRSFLQKPADQQQLLNPADTTEPALPTKTKHPKVLPPVLKQLNAVDMGASSSIDADTAVSCSMYLGRDADLLDTLKARNAVIHSSSAEIQATMVNQQTAGGVRKRARFGSLGEQLEQVMNISTTSTNPTQV